MANAFHTGYQRLPARGFNSLMPRWALAMLSLSAGPVALFFRGGRQELWDGGDHLLVVDRGASVERYRRFQYADIEVIQRWPTVDFLLTSLVLLVAFAGFLGLALLGMQSGAGMNWNPFLLVMAALALAAAVWNWSRGPTCRTRIKTAVQAVDLPALGRASAADRTLAILRERIVSAQGEQTPEEILASPASTPSLSQLSRPENRRAHWGVAVLCLADPFLTGVAYQVEAIWLDALAMLLALAHLGACFWAIHLQRRTWWPPVLAAMPWFALATLSLSLLLVTLFSVIFIVSTGSANFDLRWQEIPLILAVAVVTSGYNFTIGAMGVRELLRLRARLYSTTPVSE